MNIHSAVLVIRLPAGMAVRARSPSGSAIGSFGLVCKAGGMTSHPEIYLWLADAVLALHLAVVLFVVVGLVLTLVGGIRHWRWVRNGWFRWCHLATIAVVVAQAWLGILCPLTTLEMWLRASGGEPGYAGSFIGHWMQQLLYVQAPAWVFVAAYSLFGLLVVLVWWWLPPRRGRVRQQQPPKGR